MSKIDLKAFLAQHPDTQYLDVLFVDICGIVRGKRYPRPEMEKVLSSGMQIPYTVYLLDVTGDSSDPCGRGFDDGDPDGTGLPVPGTLAPVPWASAPTAQVLMSMVDDDGEPADMEPRNVLAGVVKRFDELGLKPVTAVELEFYLIDRERDADGRPQTVVNPVRGGREDEIDVYSLADLDAHAEVIRGIEQACAAQGIPASTITSEYAPGQYEINLTHVDDPLTAADQGALLRYSVQRVALQKGVQATFMSKPFAEQTGSGTHIHMSLADAKGNNIFDDGSETGSETLKHAIGGMMATMGEAMAVFAPNINAYRRFGPDLFVPVTRSWAANNRSVAFRIPAGDGTARRIEHRVAGAEANPYLVMATVLAGAHHGIVNKIDPGPPWEGNACAEVDDSLPLTPDAALAALKAAEVLPAYMGEEYLTLYHETKKGEVEKFRAIASPLEYKWYL